MTSRDYVVQQITARMLVAFTRGDLVDAQNMNQFLASLERMTQEEYEEMETEEAPGSIA